MSGAFLPRGTQFQRSPDGTTYTTIGEAKKVTQSRKAEILDATNMDTATAYREKVPGLIDPGDIKVDLHFLNNDAVQNALETDFSNQTNLYWKIVLPNTRGHYAFQGYVTELAPDFDVTKLAAQSLGITVTGPVVWTPNA